MASAPIIAGASPLSAAPSAQGSTDVEGAAAAIVRRSLNSYQVRRGKIVGTVVEDDGRRATIVTPDGEFTTFRWRAAHECGEGDEIVVVMPHEGVSAKRDRPLLIVNLTRDLEHREQNAPPAMGRTPILVALALWVLGAAAVSGLLLSMMEGLWLYVFLLLATAVIVWRIAIATYDLKMDERNERRVAEEEEVCNLIRKENRRDDG